LTGSGCFTGSSTLATGSGYLTSSVLSTKALSDYTDYFLKSSYSCSSSFLAASAASIIALDSAIAAARSASIASSLTCCSNYLLTFIPYLFIASIASAFMALFLLSIIFLKSMKSSTARIYATVFF